MIGSANSSIPTFLDQAGYSSLLRPSISRLSIRRAIGYIGERLNGNPFTHPKPGGATPRVSHVSGFPQSQFLNQKDP